MPSMTANSIYAELLSNIRQVSVIAVLQSPSNASTAARLSSDRDQFLLSHNGETMTLFLPAKIAPDFKIQAPVVGKAEISWRLPLAAQLPNSSRDFSDAPASPWPASKLIGSVCISCRNCGSVLVRPDSVKGWKDLPSENWAEMMDFWHCHKPSAPTTDNGTTEHHDPNESKAYGANHRFTASPGVGFVDLTYFLLSAEDCIGVSEVEHMGIKKEAKSANAINDLVTDTTAQDRHHLGLQMPPEDTLNSTQDMQTLSCQKCNHDIGARDYLAFGNRLYKWSVSVVTNSAQSQPHYPLSNFIVAYLLSLISAQAVQKFILHGPKSKVMTETPPILYVWVFAPHLTVSFSPASKSWSTLAGSKARSVPATKVFYNTITVAEQDSLLENTTLSAEEIVFPHSVIKELHDTLRASTAILPPSAQRFREWNVGLLQRYVGE
ncbi:MAG: hypothetical protein M1818_000762 [Claussenomyces sp. TS43310]|nr:MAG: hypothetical protein M1818_000762 [Claussenomyces sp. TS43310]